MIQKSALFILLLLITGVVLMAQEATPQAEPIPMDSPPPQLVPFGPVETETVDALEIILEPYAINATNSCENATTLTVPGGGSQIVNSFNIGLNDPSLNGCFWGNPSSSTGYRTGWFKFVAPYNGTAHVDTIGSTYDTVVAVHRDSDPLDGDPACTDLVRVACNDDHNGVTSRVQFPVEKNITYFIEVADWQAAVSGDARLLLSLEVEDINSHWQAVDTMSLARTRHATAVVDNRIFVIGGQTNALGNPAITPRIDWYNTLNGNWVALGQMPGVGYANTTAAYVSRTAGDGKCTAGCIYLPGGYNGAPAYNGTHYAYDLATGEWIERAPIDNLVASKKPFAWSTAVTIPDNSGYYLVGGLTNQPAITTTAEAHNELFFYRVADNKWLTDNQPNMNTARYGHMAAMLGSRLCVVGGIGTGLVLLPGGECYDFNNPGAGWQPISALNEPRYGAGSTVASDGRWYIYGGSNALHKALSSVEVYDPIVGNWSLLNVNFDLGASEGILPRAWPRGGFVNDHIWAMGGNATEGSYPVFALIEKLFVPSDTNYLPRLHNGRDFEFDTFGTARGFGINQPLFANFDKQLDLVDVYFFDLPDNDQVNIKLSQIPSGSNYDLEIYNDNKLLLGEGTNLSSASESVLLTLTPGRYYIMVKRVFPFGPPNTQNYRLIVEK